MWRCSNLAKVAAIALVGCAAAAKDTDNYQPEIKPAEVRRMTEARDLLRQGKSKEAAEALRQLIAVVPDYFLAHYNLGIALSNLGDNKGSLAAFQKALAIRDAKGLNEWSIYNSTGWAYMILGDARKAEELLKVAEAHADQMPRASQAKLWNNLGYLHMSNRDFAKARPYLDRAKAMNNSLADDNLRVLNQMEASQRPR